MFSVDPSVIYSDRVSCEWEWWTQLGVVSGSVFNRKNLPNSWYINRLHGCIDGMTSWKYRYEYYFRNMYSRNLDDLTFPLSSTMASLLFPALNCSEVTDILIDCKVAMTNDISCKLLVFRSYLLNPAMHTTKCINDQKDVIVFRLQVQHQIIELSSNSRNYAWFNMVVFWEWYWLLSMVWHGLTWLFSRRAKPLFVTNELSRFVILPNWWISLDFWVFLYLLKP